MAGAAAGPAPPRNTSKFLKHLVCAVFESNGALVRKKEFKNDKIKKSEIERLHEEFLKLLENYDKRIRPGLGAPLPVTVNMLVQSISKLDQVDMRYEMGVFLRQEWTDPRLDFRTGCFTYINYINHFNIYLICGILYAACLCAIFTQSTYVSSG